MNIHPIVTGPLSPRMTMVPAYEPAPDAVLDPALIKPVVGGEMVGDLYRLSDLPRCGCELGGQSGHVHCADVECKGCTIAIENETCRHVFIHLDGFKKFDAADRQDYVRVALKGASRRKHPQRGVDGGLGGHDEACGRIAGGAASCLDPDSDAVFVFLHRRAFSVGQFADCHDDSFRAGCGHRTIAEAGGATSAPGGGAEELQLPRKQNLPDPLSAGRSPDLDGPTTESAPGPAAGETGEAGYVQSSGSPVERPRTGEPG